MDRWLNKIMRAGSPSIIEYLQHIIETTKNLIESQNYEDGMVI